MCHLLYDQWIDVVRRDGTRVPIAPYEITDGPESNPIVALDAIRPDFNGALVQFLIGLVQTAMPPASEAAWRKGLLTPPSKDELLAAFEPYAEAFVFDGDGARFMQEIDLHKRTDLALKNYWNVNNLLIDNEKDARDLFSKFNPAPKYCLKCAAQALFTLQINTPGFGRSHFSSIRHGGPITSIVRGTTLWETVWFNTLIESDFYGNRSSNRHDLPKVFPWLDDRRISRGLGLKEPLQTNVEDVDLVQVYWPMSLRIRLIHDEDAEAVCDLCGSMATPLVSRFITVAYGTKYSGTWHHPLTPHQYEIKGKMPVPSPDPISMKPFWIGYRRWLGLVQTDTFDPNLRKEPATVILQHRLRQRENYSLMRQYDTTLQVFGYHSHPKRRRKIFAIMILKHPYFQLRAQSSESSKRLSRAWSRLRRWRLPR